MECPGEDQIQAILGGSLLNDDLAVFGTDEFPEGSQKLAMGGIHLGQETDGRQLG
jgi:hypothetical protein